MRALLRAVVLGSGLGLGLGVVYLAAPRNPEPVAHPVRAVAQAAQPATRTATLPLTSVSLPVAPPQAAAAPAGSAPLRGRLHFAVFDVLKPAKPFRFAAVDQPTDRNCLAEAVYFEARGESDAGQRAVAQVVLNRVRHPAFPKTVCGVVHQRTAGGCQFSFVCSSLHPELGSAAWRRAESVAASALHGTVMAAVGDATHFQAVRSGAFAGLLRVAQIGAHVFYRFGGHEGSPAMFHQAPSPSAPVQLASLEARPQPVHAPVSEAAVVLPAGSKADALPARIAAAAPTSTPAPTKAEPARVVLAKLPVGSKPDALPARLEPPPAAPKPVETRQVASLAS